MMPLPGLGDVVIYRLRRWEVVRTCSVVQSPDPSVPHRPNELRLLHAVTGEAVWAPEDQVVVAVTAAEKAAGGGR